MHRNRIASFCISMGKFRFKKLYFNEFLFLIITDVHYKMTGTYVHYVKIHRSLQLSLTVPLIEVKLLI